MNRTLLGPERGRSGQEAGSSSWMSSSNFTTSPSITPLTPGGIAKSIPNALRRNSPVASKPAWRGPPPGNDSMPPKSTASVSGRVTSPIVRSPTTDHSSLVARDAGRPERHGGTASHVEQIGRTDVSVAVGVARVDRRQVDGGRQQRRLERIAHVELRVEPGEAAAHLGHAEVTDREADRRVVGVERPAARARAAGRSPG